MIGATGMGSSCAASVKCSWVVGLRWQTGSAQAERLRGRVRQVGPPSPFRLISVPS